MDQRPPVSLALLPLAEAPLAFVDIETTGLEPWSGDRICEIAVVRFRGGREVGRLSTLLNPLRPISPGAFAVNGITSAMVAGAPTFREVASAVREALEDVLVVAHNAPFDVGFLSRELAMAGLGPPSGLVVDTLGLARRSFRFPRNSLDAIASRLGVRAPEHCALGDALTTREVFERLVGTLYPTGALVADVLRSQGGTVLWPATPSPAVLPPDLVEVVQSRQGIRLWYVSADGRQTERRVDPIAIASWSGSTCLVGYCHLRQEQRSFRLDRIVRWRVETAPADMAEF